LAKHASQLAGAGQWVKAEACYRELVELVPGRAELRNDLAGVLLKEGRAAEAAEQFHKALDIDPANEAARAGLKELPEH